MVTNERRIILTTERLVLSVLESSDFKDLFSLLSNEKVHQYFPKTLNREESAEFLGHIQARQQKSGLSFWAVHLRETHTFIGICGLLQQRIDGIEEIEVGYRLYDHYWGQGLGTEAAKGCLDYGRNELQLKSIISLIRPINMPSIRVAEKNGLILEKETMFYDLLHQVYRIRFDSSF